MRADVVLLGCGKAKASEARPARELYTGNLFRLSLRYAELRAAEGGVVYVVSAEHGLVELDQVVEPYEKSLQGSSKREREAWGLRTFDDVRRRHQQPGNVVILAGDVYAYPLRRAALLAKWTFEEPLRGLDIGGRLAQLKAWGESLAREAA